ncbi:MAG: T9SS type A sorting domain-containing protein [Bacteroidales bacterium]|nr:T9SS type A sorting domain-containing protein [Bacteroidales bacterium]MDD3666117.1 T9SS type A sorting domain-containing protein [Bacteroidales bacterium]
MLYAIWDFRANKYWRGYDQRWSYNPCQLITVSSFAELDTALQVWKISRIDSTQYLYDTIPVKSISREYEADTTKTIAVSVFSPIDDTTTEITTTLWEGEYQQQSGIRKEHIVKSPATATSYHIFLREKYSGSWEPYKQLVTAPITLNINGIELEGSNETEQFFDPILEEWINISRNLILHNPQATCYMFEDWIADEWRPKSRALFYYNLAGSDSLWVFSSFDPTNSNYNLTDVTEYCYQNDKLHYKTLRRIENGNSSWISIWRYYYPEGYGIINQSNNRAGLVCYPNPTTGSFHFIVDDPYTEVFIYDSEGKLCQKETLESGIQQMDFSHLRPGFYVMVVAGQSQKSWQRIIRL